MSEIGKNIRFIRQVNNLSQQKFGELIGITRASVGSYEEGRAEPKIDTLIHISKAFKISIDDLLTKDFNRTKSQLLSPSLESEEEKAKSISKYEKMLEKRVEALEKWFSKLDPDQQ